MRLMMVMVIVAGAASVAQAQEDPCRDNGGTLPMCRQDRDACAAILANNCQPTGAANECQVVCRLSGGTWQNDSCTCGDGFRRVRFGRPANGQQCYRCVRQRTDGGGRGSDRTTVIRTDERCPQDTRGRGGLRWLDPDCDGRTRDNCPFEVNPDQHDADGDGLGDACDDDPQTALWSDDLREVAEDVAAVRRDLEEETDRIWEAIRSHRHDGRPIVPDPLPPQEIPAEYRTILETLRARWAEFLNVLDNFNRIATMVERHEDEIQGLRRDLDGLVERVTLLESTVNGPEGHPEQGLRYRVESLEVRSTECPPGTIRAGQQRAEVASDPDCDGVAEAADNCDEVHNPDQRDLDRDGLGAACDADDERSIDDLMADASLDPALEVTGVLGMVANRSYAGARVTWEHELTEMFSLVFSAEGGTRLDEQGGAVVAGFGGIGLRPGDEDDAVRFGLDFGPTYIYGFEIENRDGSFDVIGVGIGPHLEIGSQGEGTDTAVHLGLRLIVGDADADGGARHGLTFGGTVDLGVRFEFD